MVRSTRGLLVGSRAGSMLRCVTLQARSALTGACVRGGCCHGCCQRHRRPYWYRFDSNGDAELGNRIPPMRAAEPSHGASLPCRSRCGAGRRTHRRRRLLKRPSRPSGTRSAPDRVAWPGGCSVACRVAVRVDCRFVAGSRVDCRGDGHGLGPGSVPRFRLALLRGVRAGP
jgi:hypothetical protein